MRRASVVQLIFIKFQSAARTRTLPWIFDQSYLIKFHKLSKSRALALARGRIYPYKKEVVACIQLPSAAAPHRLFTRAHFHCRFSYSIFLLPLFIFYDSDFINSLAPRWRRRSTSPFTPERAHARKMLLLPMVITIFTINHAARLSLHVNH